MCGWLVAPVLAAAGRVGEMAATESKGRPTQFHEINSVWG